MELIKIFFLLTAIVVVTVSSKTDGKQAENQSNGFCTYLWAQIQFLEQEIREQCYEQSELTMRVRIYTSTT